MRGMRKLAALSVIRFWLCIQLWSFDSLCLQDSKEGCALCGEKILEDHISCDKKVFHPRCMKCQVCGEQLRGKYLIHKDWPICEKDFRVSGQLGKHLLKYHSTECWSCLQRV